MTSAPASPPPAGPRRRSPPMTESRSPARLPPEAGRLLARRFRLACPGGGAQRVPAVHHRHRRPDHPLPARPVRRARCPAAHPDARLAELPGRVHATHRTAHRPARPTAAIRLTPSTSSSRACPATGSRRRCRAAGFNLFGVAQAWAELMTRLGYERFAAQGTDVGSGVAGMLPMVAPGRVVGIHLTGTAAAAPFDPPLDPEAFEGPDRDRAERLNAFREGRDRLPRHAVDPPADAGLRPARLARRAAGLDRREVPRVDRPRPSPVRTTPSTATSS